MNNDNHVLGFKTLDNKCKHCYAASFCLSSGLSDTDLSDFDTLVKRRKPLQRGERLFYGGDDFRSLYIVHSGSVKTYVESSDGEQQITGFYFPGDLLGFDGFEKAKHTYSVEALETSSFCEVPARQFEEAARRIPRLQQQFFRFISTEISREQELMLLLGKMTSKRRLASFFINISLCMQKQGYAADSINLTMTRHDIANYLGLVIETVSRLLTDFHNKGVLKVMRRHIEIKNPRQLISIANNCAEDEYPLKDIA